MSLVDTDTWFSQFVDDLHAQVQREMRVSVWHESKPEIARDYLAGTEIVRAGNDIVVTVSGMIPNFIEHGLGPGGVGTEGPFDMRANVLKGRTHRAVPLPQGIRTMSIKGKPWIHPGFKRMAYLPKLQAKLAWLAREAEHFGSAFRPSDDWRYNPRDIVPTAGGI